MKFIKGFFAVSFFILVFVGISQYIKTSQPANLAASAFCFIISVLLFRSLFKKKNKADITVQSQSNNKKARYSRLIIIFIILGIISIGISTAIKNSENVTKKSLLSETLDLNEEQENSILSVFSECEIGEITAIELVQENDDKSSYYLTDNEVSHIVVWIRSDKSVESIYYHDYDIYVNGEVISPLTNYYVNSEDKNEYRTIAQTIIKETLNHPGTAKFSGIGSWKFGVQEDGSIVVQSTVTAENSFGVQDSLDFQIIFNNHTPISLILDGQEYIQ